MLRFFFGTLAGAIFLFMPLQEVLSQSLNQPDPVQFVIAPDTPGPGESVLIEAQGVGNFLGEATITWQVNGQTVLSGLGERSFSFTLGTLGTQTTVRVTINSPTRGVISRTFTFLPSVVHMVWEADTTTPPWYRSKALYSAGSRVTVTAFPQVIVRGASVTSNNLSFQWRRNGTPVTEQSGRGKSSISFDGNQLFISESIEVDVQANGSTIAQGTIVIPATRPLVLFYDRDPLRGVLYDEALQNTVSLGEKEITLRAEPYFFAKTSLQNGALPYVWTLNNKPATGPDTVRGLLTLRQTGSGAGSASVGVSLQNNDTDKLVQSAKTAIRIVFGGQSANGLSSFFGL